MKVVHIESGLGNQMLSYCELLALKKVQPNDQYYIETLVYDFPDASQVINQWQGYELNRIFDINDPNVSELFSEEQWNDIKRDIQESEFWKKSWNWPIYFTNAFERQGLSLHNLRGDFEEKARINENSIKGRIRKKKIYQLFQKTWIYSNLRTWNKNRKPYLGDDTSYLFYQGTEDILTGQKLSFMYRNNNIENIESEIRSVFHFPEIVDKKNCSFLKKIENVESIAIHARRGDMLGLNGRYYKGGYFRRSVKFMKKNIENPVFCFFCDPGSIEWCKKNGKIFGLDYSKDKVLFVDWNNGKESYRDMQLMSYCKHNVITISSFGWWGAYLNNNPYKITISPEIEINTTHHF